MSMKKHIDINIRTALNAAGINATEEQVKRMSESVRDALRKMDAAAKASKPGRGMVKSLVDVKAAWDIVAGAAKAAIGAIKRAWDGLNYALTKSFHYETMTRQFKILVGGIDEAKAHMADLKALGDTPPFSLDEFAAASRSMLVRSEGALGYKASLELVGDAAAATGVELGMMGAMVGRLYALVRDGQPISSATEQLRNLGVLTPEIVAKLAEMQKAGKSNVEIWGEVEKALGRFKGAMTETEDTGEGLFGAIGSRWDNLVRQFGNAFASFAKDGLDRVLDAMKRLEEDGTIAVWADRASRAVDGLFGSLKKAGESVSFIGDLVWNKLGLSDLAHGANAIVQGAAGAVSAAIGGGSLSDMADAWRQYSQEEALKGYYARKFSGLEAEDEEREAALREEAVQRKREEAERAAAVAARREAEEKRKRDEALAEAQRKAEERNAKERDDALKGARDRLAKLADETAAGASGETAAKAVDKSVGIVALKSRLADEEMQLSALRSAATAAVNAAANAKGGAGSEDFKAAQEAAKKALDAYAKQKGEVEKVRAAIKGLNDELKRSFDDEAKRAIEKRRDDELDAIKKAHDAKMDALDEEIAKARQEAQAERADFNRRADEARGADDFAGWQKMRKDAERDALRRVNRLAANEQNVDREIARLAKRENLKSFSEADAQRLAQLREFKELIQPGERKTKKELREEALEQERKRRQQENEEKVAKLRERWMQDDIRKIRDELMNGITP